MQKGWQMVVENDKDGKNITANSGNIFEFSPRVCFYHFQLNNINIDKMTGTRTSQKITCIHERTRYSRRESMPFCVIMLIDILAQAEFALRSLRKMKLIQSVLACWLYKINPAQARSAKSISAS